MVNIPNIEHLGYPIHDFQLEMQLRCFSTMRSPPRPERTPLGHRFLEPLRPRDHWDPYIYAILFVPETNIHNDKDHLSILHDQLMITGEHMTFDSELRFKWRFRTAICRSERFEGKNEMMRALPCHLTDSLQQRGLSVGYDVDQNRSCTWLDISNHARLEYAWIQSEKNWTSSRRKTCANSWYNGKISTTVYHNESEG